MTDLIVKDNIKIEDLIYEVRGKQVMLDKDVALLYNVETKALNQTIKRNINRFPDSFCFKLTEEEYKCVNLKFQIETSNNNNMSRSVPYAFKDLGIKCFTINRVDNSFLLDCILQYLNNY